MIIFQKVQIQLIIKYLHNCEGEELLTSLNATSRT